MANTWPCGQPCKKLNSLNRGSTPLSLLVIDTLLPGMQLPRASVSPSISYKSSIVHQLHARPWKVTSAPGRQTGEKNGESCELHIYVMNTSPAHQQMNRRIWCKRPFEPVNKPLGCEIISACKLVSLQRSERVAGGSGAPRREPLPGGHVLALPFITRQCLKHRPTL